MLSFHAILTSIVAIQPLILEYVFCGQKKYFLLRSCSFDYGPALVNNKVVKIKVLGFEVCP